MSHPPTRIWNPAFSRVFVAAGFQEMSFALLVHIPAYLAGLGGSEGQIGLVYSLAALVALAVRPLIGRLLDLKGRKPVLAVVSLVDVIAMLLYLLLGSFGPAVYAVRILQGTTEIILFTGYLAYAADALPPRRRTAGMAYFGLSGLVPIGLGPLLGDGLLAIGSYRTIFVVAAAFGLAGWIIVLGMPRLEHAGDEPRRSFRAAVLQREIVPLWIIVFAFAAVMTVLFTFMATFVETTGFGSVGLFFLVYGGTAVTVRLAAATLPDRFGYRPVLIPTFLGLVVLFVLLAAADTVALFVVAAALGGFGHGIVFPILSSEAVNRSRTNERGSALAFFTALFDVATLAVAPAVGAIIDGSGYRVAFGSVAVLLLVALVSFAVADRRVMPADSPGMAESAS